jgi:hypothetical protein
LARFILALPRGVEIRHRNGNRFDCRRENLIVVTRGDGQHQKKYPLPSSGFRGVYHDRRSDRWGASITREKQFRWLGYFRTAEEAARCYDEAARELFGSGARLNFPEGQLTICQHLDTL